MKIRRIHESSVLENIDGIECEWEMNDGHHITNHVKSPQGQQNRLICSMVFILIRMLWLFFAFFENNGKKLQTELNQISADSNQDYESLVRFDSGPNKDT